MRSSNLDGVRRRCPWIVLALAPSVFGQAVISGNVKLPAARAKVVAAHYQIKTSGVVAPPDLPVAVVYLEGTFPAAALASPPADAEMGQRHYEFTPGLLAVRRGARVFFPNYDDDYHNVLSYSKAKEFDLGRYRKDERPAPAIVFDKPGVVELACEIHEHMSGTILVLDTPYFTKSDTNGNYQLENLPAGSFTLKAWVNERTVWQTPVALQKGSVLRVDFPGAVR